MHEGSGTHYILSPTTPQIGSRIYCLTPTDNWHSARRPRWLQRARRHRARAGSTRHWRVSSARLTATRPYANTWRSSQWKRTVLDYSVDRSPIFQLSRKHWSVDPAHACALTCWRHPISVSTSPVVRIQEVTFHRDRAARGVGRRLHCWRQ